MDYKEITLIFGPKEFRWFRIKISRENYDRNGMLIYNRRSPLGLSVFENSTEEAKYKADLSIDGEKIVIKLYWTEERTDGNYEYVGEFQVTEKSAIKTFGKGAERSSNQNLDKETVDKILSLKRFH
jgi:hypothetical protein